MGLQVLGAGLPRSGTNSLKSALETLGYPCAHMETLMQGGMATIAPWHNYMFKGEVIDAKGVKRDFKWLFETQKKTAGVDYPISQCYKEIFAEHPDCKVILTVREVEGWIKSFRTLEDSVTRLLRRVLIPLAKCLCWKAPQKFGETALELHGRFEGSALYPAAQSGGPGTYYAAIEPVTPLPALNLLRLPAHV